MLVSVTLKEREELESLLIADPDAIEPGLKVIARQLMTDYGPVDILAVDDNGALIVIELKNGAVDYHLDQGLRCYDWCRQNFFRIGQLYKNKFSIDWNMPLRLMLIAPFFTDLVVRNAKSADCELDLTEYHAFEDGEKRREVFCTRISYWQPPPAFRY